MDPEVSKKKGKKSKTANLSANDLEKRQINNGVSFFSNDNITSSRRRRIRRKISLKKRSEVQKNSLTVDEAVVNAHVEKVKDNKVFKSKDCSNSVNLNIKEVKNLVPVKQLIEPINEEVVMQNAEQKNVKMNKTREEVKAERDAKKLAKQLAKNKSYIQPAKEKVADNVEKKEETKIVQEVPQNLNVTSVISDITTGVAQVTIEKSREEIKAEREAKKLAKKNQKAKANPEDIKSSDKTEVTIKITPIVESLPTNKDQNNTASENNKAELRAKRRAIQEAQRAAKTVSKTVEPKIAKKPIEQTKTLKVKKDIEIRRANTPEKTRAKEAPGDHHKVKLFNHLYSESDRKSLKIPLNSKEIHRAIIRLGIQYASHTVIGSNARCIALLNAIKQVVRDYNLPPNVEFSRGFEAHLAPSIKFLNSCRPPAVSMNNALKHIKWQLTQLLHTTSESEGKSKLHEAIDIYIKDQIEVAGKAISVAVTNKITDDDVILTYGCSSLIEHILVDAVAEKHFRVIIVEAHPWNEGREMLRRLTSKGIKCSLVMISALSFVMREINKVILGAGALLANGYVMARAGTAQVAMVAHAHNVPVLVCCETHKFSERVQTDSFVYNEIGDPDELIKCNNPDTRNRLSNWRTLKFLTPLNLFYDVTPPDLVTAVVTELAILPCTSVPVILRMKPSEFM